MTETKNSIRDHRTAKGWSLEQLAKACQSSKSQISKLEKGHRRLTVDWMVRIGRALDCDPRDLLLASPQPIQQTHKKNAPSKGTLPILQTKITKQNKFSIGQEIDQTEAPSILQHTQDAYAIYATGNNMAPMYRDGQLLFINPHKPPTKDCGIVLTLKNKNTIICAYAKRTNNTLTIKEFSPKTNTIIINENDIASLHVIVSTIDP